MEVEWALRMCSDRSSRVVVMVLFSFPCSLSLSIPSSHLVHNDPSSIRRNQKHKHCTSVLQPRLNAYVCMYVNEHGSQRSRSQRPASRLVYMRQPQPHAIYITPPVQRPYISASLALSRTGQVHIARIPASAWHDGSSSSLLPGSETHQYLGSDRTVASWSGTFFFSLPHMLLLLSVCLFQGTE